MKLETYHATDRRIYNGAPCSDMARERKHIVQLEARMKAADSTARCTYFPMEGKYMVSRYKGGPEGTLEFVTGEHSDKQEALIEAIKVLETQP